MNILDSIEQTISTALEEGRTVEIEPRSGDGQKSLVTNVSRRGDSLEIIYDGFGLTISDQRSLGRGIISATQETIHFIHDGEKGVIKIFQNNA